MSERLYQRYDAAQLELLLAFVREGRQFNERKAAELERRTREGSSGRVRTPVPGSRHPAGTPPSQADSGERPGV